MSLTRSLYRLPRRTDPPLWIADDLVGSIYAQFVANRPRRRRIISPPGPLEARKRDAKGRLSYAALETESGLSLPLPGIVNGSGSGPGERLAGILAWVEGCVPTWRSADAAVGARYIPPDHKLGHEYKKHALGTDTERAGELRETSLPEDSDTAAWAKSVALFRQLLDDRVPLEQLLQQMQEAALAASFTQNLNNLTDYQLRTTAYQDEYFAEIIIQSIATWVRLGQAGSEDVLHCIRALEGIEKRIGSAGYLMRLGRTLLDSLAASPVNGVEDMGSQVFDRLLRKIPMSNNGDDNLYLRQRIVQLLTPAQAQRITFSLAQHYRDLSFSTLLTVEELASSVLDLKEKGNAIAGAVIVKATNAMLCLYEGSKQQHSRFDALDRWLSALQKHSLTRYLPNSVIITYAEQTNSPQLLAHIAKYWSPEQLGHICVDRFVKADRPINNRYKFLRRHHTTLTPLTAAILATGSSNMQKQSKRQQALLSFLLSANALALLADAIRSSVSLFSRDRLIHIITAGRLDQKIKVNPLILELNPFLTSRLIKMHHLNFRTVKRYMHAAARHRSLLTQTQYRIFIKSITEAFAYAPRKTLLQAYISTLHCVRWHQEASKLMGPLDHEILHALVYAGLLAPLRNGDRVHVARVDVIRAICASLNDAHVMEWFGGMLNQIVWKQRGGFLVPKEEWQRVLGLDGVTMI